MGSVLLLLPVSPCMPIPLYHGLWTPNEGINQRYLKKWADVASAIPKNLGVGVNFRPCRLFPLWASVVHAFSSADIFHQKVLCLLTKIQS